MTTMKMKELKDEVYNLSGLLTKAIKRQPRFHGLDLRRKSSWEHILEVLKQELGEESVVVDFLDRRFNKIRQQTDQYFEEGQVAKAIDASVELLEITKQGLQQAIETIDAI